MGTGQHHWPFNDEVVAMVTRLYETLPEMRPCPVPVWCVCVLGCLAQPC